MEKVKQYLNLMLDKALDNGDADSAASLVNLLDLIELNLMDKQ